LPLPPQPNPNIFESYRKGDLLPIVKIFPDIEVLNTVTFNTQKEALALEESIMKDIQGSEFRFHNWFEPTQYSGVTETRKWKVNEVEKISKIIDDYKSFIFG